MTESEPKNDDYDPTPPARPGDKRVEIVYDDQGLPMVVRTRDNGPVEVEPVIGGGGG